MGRYGRRRPRARYAWMRYEASVRTIAKSHGRSKYLTHVLRRLASRGRGCEQNDGGWVLASGSHAIAGKTECGDRDGQVYTFGSVHDKEFGTDEGRRPVCLRVVGYLIAHARPQREGAAVTQLCIQLAFHAEQNMALVAPVIG